MSHANGLAAIGALLALAACEVRVGKDKEARQAASAPTKVPGTKAEEGQLSIDAPGFAMKLDIPAGLAERSNLDSDSGLLAPGVALSGMHVQGREEGGAGESMVELRFISADTPDKVASWYRDPARAKDFKVAKVDERGGVFAIAGTEVSDGDPFDLRLSARPGGGTDGTLRLKDGG